MRITVQGATKRRGRVWYTWMWLTQYRVSVRLPPVNKTRGLDAVHWARNYSEALEWAACYGNEDCVLIGKRGKLIAARYQ